MNLLAPDNRNITSGRLQIAAQDSNEQLRTVESQGAIGDCDQSECLRMIVARRVNIPNVFQWICWVMMDADTKFGGRLPEMRVGDMLRQFEGLIVVKSYKN